ncbi:MAG: hypothetical protein RL021_183 [Bacteroidota bacterium]|jgi:hypothetical protein
MDPIPRNDEQRPAPMLLNRQVSVFLVCLSIATVFWVLLVLSGNYPTTLTFPVKYIHLPERKVVLNELPSRISVDLKTTGFRILYYRLLKSPDDIVIDVSAGLISTGVKTDVVVVPTRYFQQDFDRQLGEEVEVSGFRPDSIVLLFSDRISKRVPVLPLADFTLKRQFDTLSGPVTVPDSVTLSGPPSVIRKVRMVRTQPVKLGELQYSIDSAVALQPVALAETSPSKVRLRIPVEKFTEGIQEVAVSAVNVPSGFQLKMFPEKVKVRYQVSLSSYASVTSDQFEVVVDAGRAPVTEGNLLPLRIVSHPASIRSMSVEPAEVEFIFRKK